MCVIFIDSLLKTNATVMVLIFYVFFSLSRLSGGHYVENYVVLILNYFTR